jgi:Zn-dependent protease
MQTIHLIIALAVCITVHEASHAWVASLLGDPTAKMEGRVSLNPLRHLDVFGTLMIFIAHFGWGKPVPYNDKNLKHPRRDAALISMAGPFSNLLTVAVLIAFSSYVTLPPFLNDQFTWIVFLSSALFWFNLIPIAPLDGSKLLGLLIPRSKEHLYYRYISQGPLFILILILIDRLIYVLYEVSFIGTYLEFGFDLIRTGITLVT